MNEDIKEILDNLKYTAKKHTIQVLENGGKIEHCPQEIETELRLSTYSANLLLNYITNLQEENQKLKDANKRIFANVNDDKLLISNAMHYAQLQDCKKENQKLVKVIDELEKYIKENSIYYNTSDGCQWVNQFKLLDKLTELKGGSDE